MFIINKILKCGDTRITICYICQCIMDNLVNILFLAFTRTCGHECLIIDDAFSLQKDTADLVSYFPLKSVIRFCLNECKSIVIFCFASILSLVQHMVILFLFYTRIVLAQGTFTFIKKKKKAMLLRIVN